MHRESLLLVAPGRLEWTPDALPEPGPHEVVVRTVAGAVSIGTELPQYRGNERQIVPRAYPRMTGYESLGVVIERGAAVRHLNVGDRILSFYGHRTHAVVPEDKAIRVPGEIPEAVALLAILTCDVAKGIRKVHPGSGEAVLVSGAGAIGLLTLWVLRAYGVRMLDVIEPRAGRRMLARRLGARQAFEPSELNESRSDTAYAVGFECSGRDTGFATLQANMATNGRLCVLADGNYEPLTLAPAFHTRELTLVGSSDGWDYQEHARWFFDQVGAGAPALEAIFEEQVSAPELPNAFARMARGEIKPVKVLVRYPGGASGGR